MKRGNRIIRHYWKGVEYKTAGTYSKTLTAGRYTIIAVGGGSGGTYNLDNSGDHMEKQGSASGGSGAYLKMVVDLQDGDYEIVVGAGGAKNGGFHNGSSFPSGAGGDTYISLNGTKVFNCGGGTSATALYAASFRGSAGQGGTNTLPAQYVEIINNVNGKSGGTKAAYSYFDGGASVYEGYGAGGYSQSDWRWGNSTDGTGGYIKMVAEGTEDDYDYYTEEEVSLLPKKIARHFWKYNEEVLSSLPVFQNETEASYGNFGVSVDPTGIWQVVGQSIASSVTNSNGVYYTFNFDYPAKITSFTYQGRVVANQLPSATMTKFEVFDNDTNQWVSLWTGSINVTQQTISVVNEKYSNKYRIYLVGSEVGRYAGMGTYTINMSGNKKIAIPSTSQNYDFYTDDETYFVINQ